MTSKELIEQLGRLPPDMPVCVTHTWGYECEDSTVEARILNVEEAAKAGDDDGFVTNPETIKALALPTQRIALLS